MPGLHGSVPNLPDNCTHAQWRWQLPKAGDHGLVGGLCRMWHVRTILPKKHAVKHHLHSYQEKPGRVTFCLSCSFQMKKGYLSWYPFFSYTYSLLFQVVILTSLRAS